MKGPLVLFLGVHLALAAGCHRRSATEVPADFSYPKFCETILIETPFSAPSLSGTVADPTGFLIKKALVERVSADWDTRLDAVFTDSKGRFDFPGLPEGRYFLKLSYYGFKDMLVTVIVSKTSKEELHFELELGS